MTEFELSSLLLLMITWQHACVTKNGDDTAEHQRASKLAELSLAPPKDRGIGLARTAVDGNPADPLPLARREFARLLGEFRRTAVLVPYDEHGSLWTADFGGVRWICAFSDEGALARFAEARGDATREWTYRTVLGARLLDEMVPTLPGPGGVALDAGSADGVVFPPVAGIVPDEVAVDLGGTGTR
ncbi:SseB family protein [Streptomyces sp. NPDC056463]|uniref:SseB family protein n=1 Tax=unclassified Streptomyces TaxID=2593676 RepID=UPI0036AFDEED